MATQQAPSKLNPGVPGLNNPRSNNFHRRLGLQIFLPLM